MRMRVPAPVVDGTANTGGEAVAVLHRRAIAQVLGVGFEGREEAVALLDDGGPVMQRANPLELVALAQRLWVGAEVGVCVPRHPANDVALESGVVVRPRGLNRTAAPPAAALGHGAGRAHERAGRPGGEGLGGHLHRGIDSAADLGGQVGVECAVSPLRARRGRPTLVVVLIAGRKRCVPAGLPHA